MNQIISMGDNKKLLYINIDDLPLYYEMFRDEIDNNSHFYLNYVNKNRDLYNDYKKLCDTVQNVCIECQRNVNEQNGGSMSGLLISGVVGLSSYTFTILMAFLLWYTLSEDTSCKDTYPMYPQDKIPDVQKILESILPSSWISDKIKQGKNINDAVNDTSVYLDELVKIFSVIDETSGSQIKKVGTKIIHVGLSAVAAVVTSGMGGDKIVNIPFFITKAINMIAKTYDKLRKVIGKIVKVINEIIKVLNEVHSKINIGLEYAEQFNNNLNDLKRSSKQMTFIYDLYYIKLSKEHGSNQIKCWVEYILKYYMTNTERTKEIYTLFCIMNDIYLTINDEVINFVASTLDMIVPESMGLFSTLLVDLLKKYDYIVYKQAYNQLIRNFNKIPKQYKLLILEPELMKKFAWKKINNAVNPLPIQIINTEKIISYLPYGDPIKKNINTGIDMLAYGLNKGVSMTFMFLNLFIIFAELNHGVNKTLSGINYKALLDECKFCGDFNLTNNIDIDISNCKKCQKFYSNNDNPLHDNDLYDECKKYKGKREKAREITKKAIVNVKHKYGIKNQKKE